MTDKKYRPKTLNEINQICIDQVKVESLDMCDEVLIDRHFSIDALTVKYNYLYTKVPSIFNKILRDINDEINRSLRPDKDGINRPFIFNKSEFVTNLDIVLQQLSNIQERHISNQDPGTHKNISDNFNGKYIPSKFMEHKN